MSALFTARKSHDYACAGIKLSLSVRVSRLTHVVMSWRTFIEYQQWTWTWYACHFAALIPILPRLAVQRCVKVDTHPAAGTINRRTLLALKRSTRTTNGLAGDGNRHKTIAPLHNSVKCVPIVHSQQMGTASSSSPPSMTLILISLCASAACTIDILQAMATDRRTGRERVTLPYLFSGPVLRPTCAVILYRVLLQPFRGSFGDGKIMKSIYYHPPAPALTDAIRRRGATSIDSLPVVKRRERERERIGWKR